MGTAEDTIRSSSSSRIMMRGVTISIKLSVSRPMPMFRNKRLIMGIFERIGTPDSWHLSQALISPSKHGAAVGDGDRGAYGVVGEVRQLEGAVDGGCTAAQAAAADGRGHRDGVEAGERVEVRGERHSHIAPVGKTTGVTNRNTPSSNGLGIGSNTTAPAPTIGIKAAT